MIRRWTVMVLLVLGACSSDEPAPALLRLADTLRIASVISPEAALAAGELAVHESLQARSVHDGSVTWRPYRIAEEFGGEFAAGSVEPSWEGGRLSLPPGSGVACGVALGDMRSLLVDAEGGFDSGLRVRVCMLKIPCPEVLPAIQPTQLAAWLGATRIQRPLSLRVDGGGRAELSFTPHEKTQGLLFLVENTGDQVTVFERLRLFALPPLHSLVAERRVDERFVARVDFAATVRPALVATPGTTITTRPSRLPPRPELQFALAAQGNVARPLSVTVEMVGDAERHILLERSIAAASDDWEEIAVPIELPRSSEVQFVFRCAPADDGESRSLVMFGSPTVVGTQEPRRPNVLFISIDTLRADRLGAYGQQRDLTPRLDALADDSFVFENSYAQSSYTLPTHVSLFSGLFPPAHGVERFEERITRSTPLLAELLAREGYVTASFNGAGLVSHVFGFDRGFDLYCEVDPVGDWTIHGRMEVQRLFPDGSAGSLDRALAFVSEHVDRSWFLFLHTYMTHEYLPPEPLARRFGLLDDDDPPLTPESVRRFNSANSRRNGISDDDRIRLVDTYDATVVAADRMVGEVLDHLRQAGLFNRTIVVVSSDHGEELFDHGFTGHAVTVYEELIRVPLLVRLPGGLGGQRIAARVNQTDVLPTLLELLDIDCPREVQGESFAAALRGDTIDDRTTFSLLRSARRAVIHNDMKYIRNELADSAFSANEPEELFDLRADPLESNNLADVEQTVRNALSERLDRFLDECARLRSELLRRDGGQTLEPLPPDLAGELEQLGYLGQK